MNRLYQIYDRKAETVIGNIMSAKADAVAIRTFGDAMRQPDSMIATHPEDFDLIFLGEQDDDGTIIRRYTATGLPLGPDTIMQGLVMQQLLNAPKDAQ